MNIAVLGAGAGGTTLAFDYAAHGHEVSLFDFPQFPGNIAAIAEQQGIHADGDIRDSATSPTPVTTLIAYWKMPNSFTWLARLSARSLSGKL